MLYVYVYGEKEKTGKRGLYHFTFKYDLELRVTIWTYLGEATLMLPLHIASCWGSFVSSNLIYRADITIDLEGSDMIVVPCTSFHNGDHFCRHFKKTLQRI
jgi:hypothetical protein